MNAITKTDPKPMLLDFMAGQAGLKPEEFSATVRKTCGMVNASAEEFAAFLMVAREYNLNPLLKEIYAFPAKGGGVVPIVSIDGWVNLVNSHPAADGFEFDVEHDDKGELVAITCRMYRKDRNRPVVVTEYYDECRRNTEPWKMKHRMLRHKAMIQAARYAFGFSGIYDEDEGARIAEMKDVTPKAAPTPPKPPVPPQVNDARTERQSEDTAAQGEQQSDIVDAEVIDPDAGEVTDEHPADGDGAAEEARAALAALDTALANCTSAEEIVEVWNEHDMLARFGDYEDVIITAKSYKRNHTMRLRSNG